jgi:YesN/AraC family two-component response regulator
MFTICIIEDLIEIQRGLQTIIESDLRFKLLKSFENAETAIELLPQLNPDIILTDINLPGKSGIDCITEIKSIIPNTQFIMFTIYEDDDQVLRH